MVTSVGVVELDALDSGRLTEFAEPEAALLGNADGADRGILVGGRGVEVALGPTSFGVAETLILLWGTAAGVVVQLECAPLFLHQTYSKEKYQQDVQCAK